MKYYIFRVKDTIGQEYYILNNQYIGYLSFDSNRIRSILEGNIKSLKRKYQLFASGEVLENRTHLLIKYPFINDRELHKIFCDSERFSKEKALKLAKKFKLKISKDKKWYEIFYPNKKTSESLLRCVVKSIKSKKLHCEKSYFIR